MVGFLWRSETFSTTWSLDEYKYDNMNISALDSIDAALVPINHCWKPAFTACALAFLPLARKKIAAIAPGQNVQAKHRHGHRRHRCHDHDKSEVIGR